MMEHFLGIDLGTTNSAAAVSDGTNVVQVKSAQGGVITPSVVRIDGKKNVMVGQRARRFLESDPENTRAEFKRLMGTGRTLAFTAAKLEKAPTELAAEVLRALRADVAQQIGAPPARAVITVPAMFELPQSAATAEAARLAGFSQVEFLQEPVASAIAAGWNEQDAAKSWLVYDLGGGTFDVSLVETQEGVLRVVGHDGDNFLGGRDIDSAISELVIAEIEKTELGGASLDRRANAVAIRRLRVLAEEAKVDAGRGGDLIVTAPGLFSHEGNSLDVDVTIPHSAFAGVVLEIVDKSLRVCQRLLTTHGLRSEELGRVVLVGGPTLMAILRDRVASVLGAPLAKGLDPMTLVAEGAAAFAASSGFSADNDGSKTSAAADKSPDVWLQFPLVTPDLSPFVVGRMVSESAKKAVKAVRFARTDKTWEGPIEPLDEEGMFATAVHLEARTTTELTLEGIGADGASIALAPAQIRIRHGVMLSDPPLPRSIGVALANDAVRVFFERGSPLPMKRTFMLHSVEALSPGSKESALRIPIVQGEFWAAHLCRLVGTLEIKGERVDKPLPAGSAIELTLQVDRGGSLSASAHVPALGRIFEDVAQLVAPTLTPEGVRSLAAALQTRVETLYGDPALRGNTHARKTLGEIDQRLLQVIALANRAEAGDDDAGEQAARQLEALDGELSRVEAERAWPELDRQFESDFAWSSSELTARGTDTERRSFDEAAKNFQRARAALDIREAQRQLSFIESLGSAAYFRSPDAWSQQFAYHASRVSEATDLAAATKLVERGRKADASNDTKALEEVVSALRKLLPASAIQRVRSHGSGIR